MKRLSLISLALVSLLLGVSAAIGSQEAPAQAETVIPAYGAPAYVDGSPIGGGVGYSRTYSAADANYVVNAASGLKSALASATSGQVVYVADGATITLNSTSDMYSSSVGFYVRPGVILAGGRGRSGVTEGVIRLASGFYNSSYYFLIQSGTGADVCGLHIDGPQDGITGGNYWGAIKAGNSSEIHNNEIHGFGYCGVSAGVDINDVHVHHNYLHHIRQTGYGYPVVVNGSSIYHTASATVEANTIDYARHFIAAAHGRSSYTFRYNHLGANCTESQIDCHGQNDGHLEKDGNEYIYPAGENLQIYNNTSLNTTQPLVVIRGTPYSAGSISVHHNWTYLSQTYTWTHKPDCGGTYSAGAIAQCMTCMPEYGYVAAKGGAYVRMASYDNWFGTTPPPSTNGAPVLDTVGNKAVVELATLAFTISATDPDGDTLTYSASNLPAGATFDSATGTFSWTPEVGQAGVYANIHFQVSDGSLSDAEDITITVSHRIQADVNRDGAVNSLDMIRVGQHWNETGPSGWIPEDINKDGVVNVLDATLVGQNWTG